MSSSNKRSHEPRLKTTMRIPESLVKALDTETELTGIGSRSALIEAILARYLRRAGHKGLKVRGLF